MLKIGDVCVESNLVLGPMAGITDRAFRELAVEFGAGLVYSEMISAKALFYNDKKTFSLMEFSQKERPFALQLFGSEPKMIEYACKQIKEPDIIDINMGCPAPKIVNNNEGGRLMTNPDLIGELVRAAVGSTDKPVSVKMRLGWDENSVNVERCAYEAEKAGASAIAIHGRTVKQMYSGNADWSLIKKVKQNSDIVIIGNGDVTDKQSFDAIKNETGCDAVMVARASLGRPWVFGEILSDDFLMTDEEQFKTAERHISLICKYKTERIGIKEARKHALWYLKGRRNSARVKDRVSRAASLDEMLELMKICF